MSTCISQHGEYSEHEPNDDWSCNLCGAFDEPGVLDALKKAKAKVARVEARLDEEGPCLDRYLGAATCDHPGCVLERDIRAVLAELERDEEGSR